MKERPYVAKDYTTSTDAFADIPEGNYSSSDYPSMANFVTVASRLIDMEVGRWPGFFYPSTDDVSFDYDGSGEDEQEIDEFASITSVAVSENGSLSSSDYTTWTLNTDYLTKPYNASGIGKPINKLVLSEFNGTKASWYHYQKNVRVTGIAGYGTTPPDLIVQACKTQAVMWFMQAKQAWQKTGGNEDTGGLSYPDLAKLSSGVKAMLKPFILELS